MPEVASERVLIEAYDELCTEREGGFSVRCIPVSKIWNYLDRHNLPDWWEPVLRKVDNAMVESMETGLDDAKGNQPSNSKTT